MKDSYLQIRISDELKKELKDQAAKLNISISSLVTIAITEKINKLKEQ